MKFGGIDNMYDDGAKYNWLIFVVIGLVIAFGILMLYMADKCIGIFQVFC